MSWLTTAPGKKRHYFGHMKARSICGGHQRLAAIYDNREAKGDCARCKKLRAEMAERREAERAKVPA